MKAIKFLSYILIILFLPFCSGAQTESRDKILIVYLSRTTNTKIIAEIIQQKTGGRLIALELEKPYPADYRETVLQVVKENETGYLPPLKTKIDSIQNYEIVFIGFPTWGMKLPPPIKSFLIQYKFKGKKIIPFNTNDGYGIGSSFETVTQLCKNCLVLEGLSLIGGVDENGVPNLSKEQQKRNAKNQVDEWLVKLEIQVK